MSLVEAAGRCDVDVVKALVGRNPRRLQLLLWKTVQDFHTVRKTPEHVALARFLIRRGAHPHWSMICESARSGQQALVDVLLSGLQTNVFVAAAIGDEQTLSDLLDQDIHRAVIDEKGNEIKQKEVTKFIDDKTKTFTSFMLIDAGGKETEVKLMEVTAKKR